MLDVARRESAHCVISAFCRKSRIVTESKHAAPQRPPLIEDGCGFSSIVARTQMLSRLANSLRLLVHRSPSIVPASRLYSSQLGSRKQATSLWTKPRLRRFAASVATPLVSRDSLPGVSSGDRYCRTAAAATMEASCSHWHVAEHVPMRQHYCAMASLRRARQQSTKQSLDNDLVARHAARRQH